MVHAWRWSPGGAGVRWRALGGAAHLGRPAPRQLCLQLLNALATATAAAGPGPGGVSRTGSRGGAGGTPGRCLGLRGLRGCSRLSGRCSCSGGARRGPRRAGVCLRACVCRWKDPAGRGGGGVSLRIGLRRERALGRRGRTDRRPALALTPAALGPVGRRAPLRQRRGGGRRGWRCLRAHACSQTHTRATPQTHDTRRARRAPRTPAPALTLTLTLTRRPRSSRYWRRRSAWIPAGAGG